VSEARTVVVVDDDPAVRKALSRLLRADGFQVETFASAEEFLAHARSQKSAACLVLDVDLPNLDGFALQKRLSESGRVWPIVFLTGHGDIPKSVQAIRAGAADFLTKPVKADVLLPAIRAAIAEVAPAQRASAEAAELRALFESLTPREREVLEALAAGKLNKQVAADLGIVEQTVKFHRARIMERLRANSAAELMLIAAKLALGRKAGD
jgi:FixJ family two-component response regulator